MVEDQWFREMLLHSNEVEHIFAGAMLVEDNTASYLRWSKVQRALITS